MKLIIGLGNPGDEYENTRHNMGFMTLDRFAKKHNLEFKLESKFKGLLSKVDFNGNKALLLKPLTYMNLSGDSIIEVMNYYKISILDILVICDDLDSPLGRPLENRGRRPVSSLPCAAPRGRISPAGSRRA